MYTIAIDNNGYYKLGDGNLVEVNDIPNVYPLERLMAYKYNENTKMLILDEEKQKEIDDVPVKYRKDVEKALNDVRK